MNKLHYHIEVGVDDNEIAIIKGQFQKFMLEADGIDLEINPHNSDTKASDALTAVIKVLLLRLLAVMLVAEFKKVN